MLKDTTNPVRNHYQMDLPIMTVKFQFSAKLRASYQARIADKTER